MGYRLEETMMLSVSKFLDLLGSPVQVRETLVSRDFTMLELIARPRPERGE